MIGKSTLSALLLGLSFSWGTVAQATTSELTLSWDDITEADHFRLEEKVISSEDESAELGVWTAVPLESRLTQTLQKAIGQYEYRVIGCVVNPAEPDVELCEEVADYSDTLKVPITGLGPVDIEFPAAPVLADLPAEDGTSSTIGTLGGAFRVNESGAATYNIPIQLPSGIAGIRPDVSLQYSSSAGNGVMGMGWNLVAQSAVTRCRKTPETEGMNSAIDLSNADRFCLDGQKLLLVSGSYGEDGAVYTTEIDGKRRITSHATGSEQPDSFTVEGEDGSIIHYGSTDNSRLKNGDAIVSWHIAQVLDNIERSKATATNTIDYTYDKTSYGTNEMLLSSISYSGHSVVFDYNEAAVRNDTSSGYYLGLEVASTARLDSVTVNHFEGGEFVYKLAYREESINGLTQLTSAQHCAVVGVSETCQQPTTFSWAPMAQTGTFSVLAYQTYEGIMVGSAPADIDGNGVTDLAYMTTEDGQLYRIYVKYNRQPTGVGFDSEHLLHSFSSSGSTELTAADIDSDGQVELIFLDDDNWKYFDFNDSITTRAFRNNGGEPLWEQVVTRVFNFAGMTRSQLSTFKNARIFDVDGDADVDLLYNSGTPTYRLKRNLGKNADGESTWSAAVETPFTGYTHTPTPPEWFVPVSSDDFESTSSTSDSLAASSGAHDFNGDGVGDVLRYYNEYYFNCELDDPYGNDDRTCLEADAQLQRDAKLVAYVFMDGEFKFFGEVASGSNVSQDGYNVDRPLASSKRVIGDLNGDGYTDVLYDGWEVVYGTGQGFSAPEPVIIGDGGVGINSPRLVDMNNDGQVDIVYFHKTDEIWYVAYQESGDFSSKEALTPALPGYTAYGDESDYTYLAEWNGDAMVDITFVDTSAKRITFYGDRNNPGTPGNQITGIDNGFEMSSTIEYKTLLDETVYTKGNGADDISDYGEGSPVYDLISPQHVVSSVTSTAPRFDGTTYDAEHTLSVEYHYEGLRAQAGGRGLLGFETLYTYDPERDITTETIYRQDFPFIGMPSSTRQYIGERSETPGSDKILSEASNTYRQVSLHGGVSVFPYLYQSEESSYAVNDPASGKASDAVTQLQTVTVTTNTYEQPGGAAVASDEELAEDERVTVSSRYVNLGESRTEIRSSTSEDDWLSRVTTANDYSDTVTDEKWWVGRVSDATVTHERNSAKTGIVGSAELATRTRTSSFTYDAVTGMLKSETIGAGEGSQIELTTLHCYDDFGNRVGSHTHSNHYDVSCSATSPHQAAAIQPESNAEAVYRFSGVAYDEAGRYETASYDALFALNTVVERNSIGQPTESTDINGVVTKVRFDRFGAKQSSANSLGLQTQTLRRFGQSALGSPLLEDAGIASAVHFVERTTAAGAPTVYQYFDKIGRTVAKATQGFDGTYVMQYWRFDAYGRTTAASVPSYVGDDIVYTTSTYDDFDRLQSTSQSATAAQSKSSSDFETTGTVSYSDDGLTVTTVTESDYNGYSVSQTRTEERNLLGDLASVSSSGVAGSVVYSYDAMANLVKVTGVDGAVITTEFDDYGRKTGMDDPDKGEWDYTYNALGELVTQEDARGYTTTFYRDALGRTLSRLVSTGTGDDLVNVENTTYSYSVFSEDEGDEQVIVPSHLLQSESLTDMSDGMKQYFYDDFGRVSTVRTTVADGTSFAQQTTYDQLGRVFQQFDADDNAEGCVDSAGTVIGQCWGVRNHYNARGFLVKQEEARFSALSEGEEGKQLFTEIRKMTAMGETSEVAQGNGIVTKHTFDLVTGYQVETLAERGVLAIQDVDYTYDGFGNLRNRDNLASGYNETFEYDGAFRLLSSTDASRGAGDTVFDTITMTYDDNGNILTKSDYEGGATYNYGGAPHSSCSTSVTAGPHAVSSVGSIKFCYDANGNQTHMYDGNTRKRHVKYTHFDKADYINADGITEFSYDANRNRFKRVTAADGETTTTYYVGNVEVIMSGRESDSGFALKETRRYVPGGIQTTVAETGEQKVSYLHKDHLGSLDTITNTNGEIVEKLYFDAWGNKRRLTVTDDWSADAQAAKVDELLNVAGITTRGFTGHEGVDHAGIIHMNGRIYDSKLGRFMQADPHIQAPQNSQSYNRYSYVLNNPLSYTDPSGYFFKKLFKAIGKIKWLSTIISIGLNFIPGCQVWCSALFNAAVTYAVTGSLRGALIGAFASVISPGGFSPGAFLARAVIGGVASKLQGGKFGHGFIAAGASGAAGGIKNVFGRILTSAVIGGTVSKITGGKFANGATSAAFATLVVAAYRGELKGSIRGLFGNRKGHEILKENPDNHGEEHSILGGDVTVAKWGSKDAVVTEAELSELESTLFDVTSTNTGKFLRGGKPVKILLNDEGAHFADLESSTMTIDMNNRGYFKDYISGQITAVTLHRLLAHEMSHLKFGLPDTGRNFTAVNFADKVMYEVNAVMRKPMVERRYHGNGCVELNIFGGC